MFEGVGYHNQLKYFLYTINQGPALHLQDYWVHSQVQEITKTIYSLTSFMEIHIYILLHIITTFIKINLAFVL